MAVRPSIPLSERGGPAGSGLKGGALIVELKNLRLCEAGIQYSRYKDYIIYRLEDAGDPSVPFLEQSSAAYQEGEDGRVLEFPIGSQCMEEWGISTETLAEWAKVNTPRLLPAQVVGMSGLMGGARIRKDGKERDGVFSDQPDGTVWSCGYYV